MYLILTPIQDGFSGQTSLVKFQAHFVTEIESVKDTLKKIADSRVFKLDSLEEIISVTATYEEVKKKNG